MEEDIKVLNYRGLARLVERIKAFFIKNPKNRATGKYLRCIDSDGNVEWAEFPSFLVFRGSVASVSNLENIENPSTGDVYHVVDTGADYYWDGTSWEYIGELVSVPTYTAGDNIDITDYEVSAIGYKYDANKKSFAEGDCDLPSNYHGHCEGWHTTSQNECEHAEGRHNVSHTGNDASKKTMHSIGIGNNSLSKQNAVEVMENGDAYIYGVGNYIGQSIKLSGNNIKTLLDILGTIPAAQVNSDWNASSGLAEILNKPSLATVATSGSYSDLSNKPTITDEKLKISLNAGKAYITGVTSQPTSTETAYKGVASTYIYMLEGDIHVGRNTSYEVVRYPTSTDYLKPIYVSYVSKKYIDIECDGGTVDLWITFCENEDLDSTKASEFDGVKEVVCRITNPLSTDNPPVYVRINYGVDPNDHPHIAKPVNFFSSTIMSLQGLRVPPQKTVELVFTFWNLDVDHDIYDVTFNGGVSL